MAQLNPYFDLAMTVSDTPFSCIQRRLVQGDLIAASRDIAAWMELAPADALAAHAFLLRLRGRYRAAATALDRTYTAYEEAHSHAPDEMKCLDEWIGTLQQVQRAEEAFEVLVRAAQVASDDPKTKWSIATLQLLRGDYENGWINHEARWTGSPELQNPAYFRENRMWRGEDLAGRELLFLVEQAFGDALQFERFVPQIAERVSRAGGTLTYIYFAALFPLFRRTLEPHGVRVLPHDRQAPPVFNFHLPMDSLAFGPGRRTCNAVGTAALPSAGSHGRGAMECKAAAKRPAQARTCVERQPHASAQLEPLAAAGLMRADICRAGRRRLLQSAARRRRRGRSDGVAGAARSGSHGGIHVVRRKGRADLQSGSGDYRMYVARASGRRARRANVAAARRQSALGLDGRARRQPLISRLDAVQAGANADWSAVLPQVRTDLLKLLPSGH
ncbi:tetratricopeptide (TPR) repeat protein [Paraburkholderia sp. GAS33]|uniref:hypothetical protein n=1 Tax=Paraburkholderia sp. GAS33 TaxID=3035130 RepID=UPI003D1BF6F4